MKEAAPAHKVKNKVERAYRRSDLFDKRRAMLEELGMFFGRGTAGNVVEIGRRG